MQFSMKKILIHTLVTVLLTILVFLLFFLPQIGVFAVLIALLTLFCAPFPTFIGILLYGAMQKRIFPQNKIISSIAAVLILLVIYHVCLLSYLYFASEHTRDTFTKAYSSDIPAYLLAIAIPIAEIVIRKVKPDLQQLQ